MLERAIWASMFLSLPSLLAQSTTELSAGFFGNGFPTVAFDEVRDRLVVTSGFGSLWEWDGTSWARSRATLNTGLFGGGAVCATYDPVHGRVFFVTGPWSNYRLWSYDGHAASVVGPAPGVDLLTADPVRARLVAARIGEHTFFEWDGSTWQQAADLGPSWSIQGLAYDRLRQTCVAVTTSVANASLQQTWEGNGTTWLQRYSVARSAGTLAYDSVGQRVIQRGGGGTWGWDGAGWTLLAGASGTPYRVLATDSRHGLVWSYYSFTGEGDVLMAWDGSGWSTRMHVPHADRRWMGLTFDAGRGRVVLFGGLNPDNAPTNDLWEWGGQSWIHRPAPVQPAPRKELAQAYDSLRGETVVFGGVGGQLFGDSWAWNGTSWRQLATTGPSPRRNAALAYDPVRDRTVLIGGYVNDPAVRLQDHWEWDGATWAQIAAASPVGPQATRIAFEPVSARILLVAADWQTWDYDGLQWHQLRPAAGTPWGPAILSPDEHNLYWHGGRQRLQTSLFSHSGVDNYEWFGGTTNSWFHASPSPGGVRVYDTVRAVLFDYLSSYFSQMTLQPAVAVDYGSGCGGGAGPITLTPFGRPQPGNGGMHLDLRADVAAQAAVIGLGLGPANVPLGNGCTFLLQQPIATWSAATDSNGFLHLPTPVPDLLSLRGLTVFAQAAVLAPVAPGGFALSQGLQLTFGD